MTRCRFVKSCGALVAIFAAACEEPVNAPTARPQAVLAVQNPDSGLISRWTADGDASDDHGSNHGVLQNGTTFAPGKVGQAFSFDGVDDVVLIPHAPSLSFGSRSPMTVDAWVYRTGSATLMHILGKRPGCIGGPGGINYQMFLERNPVFLGFGGAGGSFQTGAVTGVDLPLNQWTHLAGSYDGSSFRMYINGTVARVGSPGQTMGPETTADLIIGGSGTCNRFAGLIDEVELYSRALSDAEIAARYQAGLRGGLRIRPDKGGNTGVVTVRITGGTFVSGATVKLVRAGVPDVVASLVTVPDSMTVVASIDLTGAALGARDVVVTSPGRAGITIPNGFVVEQGRAPDLWVDILGTGLFRAGRPQQLSLVYGNRGNVNSAGAVLWLSGVPDSAVVAVSASPPAELPPDPSLNPNAVPPSVFDLNVGRVSILHLGPIDAGTTHSMSILLTDPNALSGTLDAWVYAGPAVDPNYNPNLRPDTDCRHLSCAQSADRAGLQESLSLARRNWFRDNIISSAFTGSGVCIGAAATLKADLEKASSLPGSKLAGWVFVAINGCAGDHDATMMVSPMTNERWLIDNFYLGPVQICRMEEVGPNRWVTPGCSPLFGLRGGCDWVPISARPVLPCRLPVKQRSFPRTPIASFDPNDKTGSLGSGPGRHMSGAEPLPYAVFFENLPSATAPAQDVVITDQLDPLLVDLTSFTLGPIAFGGKIVTPPPGVSQFRTRVDLRPANTLFVDINATLDENTGLVTWSFTSIDPATGRPPTDPLAGFLPPNKKPPEGDGSVLFTVMPRQQLATGTQIRNSASIVFDQNAPIVTPAWLNTIDATKPASRVLWLAPSQRSTIFKVRWAGTDDGAGIGDYTVYVSDNSGPFTVWQRNTATESADFAGQNGHTYAFYSVARDRTRNEETKSPAREAVTTVRQRTAP